jgi:hypothetical protein
MARDQGLQETNEPWKKPGQAAEDSEYLPPENVVEQQKNRKGVKPGVPSPLNPDSRVYG